MSEVKKEYLKDKDGESFSPIYSLCSLKTKNDRLKISYENGKIKFLFTNPRDTAMIYLTDKGQVICNTMQESHGNSKDEEMIAKHLAEQAWLDTGMSLDGTYTTLFYSGTQYEYYVEIRDMNTTVVMMKYLVNVETGSVVEDF